MSPGPKDGGGDKAPRFVALSGGVGGAKLSLGLAHLLGDRLGIVVNTGDDFEHLGLYVSPDIDTTLYTLSDLVNPETGWGRRDESWNFMGALQKLGGPGWFRLGDSDLAMHVERTRRMREGETLSTITARFGTALGVAAKVLPMSDDPVRTMVATDMGVLAFQEYFVREQCRPRVKEISFTGAASAKASALALAALAAPSLEGVIICPSNPYLSVDPILAVPGLVPALKACAAPVIAVTPLIAGKAVKGPTAKIMSELGLKVDAATVLRHYAGLIDGFVLDREDAASEAGLGLPALVTNTLMRSFDDKLVLAMACLGFCRQLSGAKRR